MISGLSVVFIVVLVLGIIGDVFAIVNRAIANQPFWMYNAFWVFILSLLMH